MCGIVGIASHNPITDLAWLITGRDDIIYSDDAEAGIQRTVL
jgi:hypothetical protein